MTYQEARSKAERFCAYQERSQQDVRRRLALWKVAPEVAEALIAELITQGFLNEARYAEAFASGHYRIKRWGRLKIVQELRRNGVSDPCIRKAMASVDFSDYTETIRRVADGWRRTHAGVPEETLPWRLYAYLSSRGFEAEEIKKLT